MSPDYVIEIDPDMSDDELYRALCLAVIQEYLFGNSRFRVLTTPPPHRRSSYRHVTPASVPTRAQQGENVGQDMDRRHSDGA